MTTPVIDLTKSQSDSPLPTSTATTSTITTITTTTTTLPPPPLQSTTDPILVRRVGELEQHIADLIQNNLDLEERDLPTIDMKEILQQRMFDKNTYKTHEVHNDLYEALQKSVDLDYSNQRLADQEEVRGIIIKQPTQPPPPPPSAGASGAPGSQALSSSKTTASALQSMAWTTSDTQYESANIPGAQELSPTDYLMQDDSITEEHVLLSDD
ncbi:hypothetical protein Tco_0856137 [Tanacetum coccineum]